MTQEVFVSLLENDGRALRAWREDRKLSFENFIGLLADRQVVTILRTGKRSPWTEEPTESEALEGYLGEQSGEVSAIASRELLAGVLDRLREELSVKMLRLFQAIWIDEIPIPKVCEELGMQAEAVYTARSRIAKRARAIAAELSGSGSPTRMSLEGL
jgi:RNA polymerase sigma-70 factor (ECF subfamily)